GQDGRRQRTVVAQVPVAVDQQGVGGGAHRVHFRSARGEVRAASRIGAHETDPSPDSSRPAEAVVSAPRLLRAAGWTALAAVLGFAVVWAFMAYLSPDRVLDFASMLQMCGIPISR